MGMGDNSLSALIGDCYCLNWIFVDNLSSLFSSLVPTLLLLCSLFWPRGTWTRDKMRCVARKEPQDNFSTTICFQFFNHNSLLCPASLSECESKGAPVVVVSLQCICISHPFVSVSCVSHRHRRTRNDKNIVEMKLNKRIKRAENVCICSRLCVAWLWLFLFFGCMWVT